MAIQHLGNPFLIHQEKDVYDDSSNQLRSEPVKAMYSLLFSLPSFRLPAFANSIY